MLHGAPEAQPNGRAKLNGEKLHALGEPKSLNWPRKRVEQAYRDGTEVQLGVLGLVLNAMVLWTTWYIDAAVAQLRAEATRSATRTSHDCSLVPC
ncbi:hypothetical protein GCM10017687_58820 [Streptomyces echinatus]